jgi:YgiT-type zinc finger domain-containing protein
MEKRLPHDNLDDVQSILLRRGMDAFTSTANLQFDDGMLLEHVNRNLSFSYRDHVLSVPPVSGWHCPACGECEFDDGEGKRYSDWVDIFASVGEA